MGDDDKFLEKALTFDDVSLIHLPSNVLPKDINLETFLTRNIKINIPLISSPMDTVTESRMAMAICHEGGIGIIHKNMPIEQQAMEVGKVKRSESGMIKNPITLPPSATLEDVVDITKKNNITSVLITENGKLKGLITSRDLWLLRDDPKNIYRKVTEAMTPIEKLITAPENTTLEQAKRILYEIKKEKLPLIDKNGNLKGLVTIKDIKREKDYPYICKDKQGRLIVGAAIGPYEEDINERAAALIAAEVDVLVLDTAHGNSLYVIDALKKLKQNYNIDVIAGNVATAEVTLNLIKAGADAIKVGIGPGSICTTRVVTGIGVPQITAVWNCYGIAKQYGIPIIADGGIRYSGDIAKAIAAGADTVMIGGLFAGTEESPGQKILYEGKLHKEYRGMGSIEAMKLGSKSRYLQEDVPDEKLVPEGIEGRLSYKGEMTDVVYQLMGGLKKGMSDCNARTIKEMQENAQFVIVTPAGQRESHPHDVIITKESPNYKTDK